MKKPLFQRRHYKNMVKTLAKDYNVTKRTMYAIRANFKRDNQNYNDARFMKAFSKEYEELHGYKWEEVEEIQQVMI